MKQKRIFYPSFIPIGLAILVGLSLVCVSRLSALGYSILVWEGLFNDLMSIYLGVVGVFAFINIIYVYKFAKNKYDVIGTIFCNVGGFFIATMIYMAWHAF
ncbi:MAG: hypothetical protein AAB482_03380 [Patescibacteria group bacterium]